jgi:hypothetical protein
MRIQGDEGSKVGGGDIWEGILLAFLLTPHLLWQKAWVLSVPASRGGPLWDAQAPGWPESSQGWPGGQAGVSEGGAFLLKTTMSRCCPVSSELWGRVQGRWESTPVLWLSDYNLGSGNIRRKCSYGSESLALLCNVADLPCELGRSPNGLFPLDQTFTPAWVWGLPSYCLPGEKFRCYLLFQSPFSLSVHPCRNLILRGGGQASDWAGHWAHYELK